MSAARKIQPNAWEDFEAMLEIGVDVGEAFFAVGAKYDTLDKQLRRRGRTDLMAKLQEWKAQDTARLKHAQGRSFW